MAKKAKEVIVTKVTKLPIVEMPEVKIAPKVVPKVEAKTHTFVITADEVDAFKEMLNIASAGIPNPNVKRLADRLKKSV